MKRTIVWPPQLSGGRCAMTPDPNSPGDDPDEALRQIVRLALFEGTSTNAWNVRDRLGIADPAFGPVSVAGQARLRAEIERQFKRLEKSRRAKLVAVTFRPGDAQMLLDVEYENLESGGRDRMEIARNA